MGEGEGKVKVGEKEYAPEELQTALSKAAAAEELQGKLEGYSKVDEFCTKYGLDIDGLVENADGAFTLVSKLVDEKIIDQSGKVIQKREEPKAKDQSSGSRDEGEDFLKALLSGDSKGLKGEEKLMAIASKALGPQLDKLSKQLEEVVGVQTGMLRQGWQEKIQGKYPNLDEDDVARVFRLASENPKVSLWDCAEKVNSRKSEVLGTLRKKHAAEFGVNLDEFDQNKLKEAQGGEGSGSAVMFQGKKFSFRKKPGDKDVVTPLEASREYLKKQGIIR